MLNFHSTLTRKDFLKGLGLAGAGLGAASAVTPMFHDLDELVASTPSTRNLPWFVKEREHGDPTTPIDWDMIQRRPYTWARMDPTLPVYDNLKAIGAPVARWLDWEDKKAEDEILYAKAREEFPGFEPGIDGFGDIRTTALTHASEMFAFGQFPQRMNLGGNMVDLVAAVRAAGGYLGSTDSYAGPKMVHTPEEMGGTKYQGTPEDNLRTLKAGIRYFGGEDVGALELDDNLKKLVFSTDLYSKSIEFGDIDECIETPTQVTIPNKCKYIFLWTMRQPYELSRRQSGRFEGAATDTSYERAFNIKAHFQDFARGLGYQMIGAGSSAMTPAGAWATLGGLGELTRASYISHPLYGISIELPGACSLICLCLIPNQSILGVVNSVRLVVSVLKLVPSVQSIPANQLGKKLTLSEIPDTWGGVVTTPSAPIAPSATAPARLMPYPVHSYTIL